MRVTTPLLCFVAICGASVLVAQPSIDPPAGPIEESGRFGTLIELSQDTTPGDADSVFRISGPGSYVLTGDIDVPGSDIGVEIAASDVTIDLNGYTIRGGGATGTGIGVTVPETVSETFSNAMITNGSMRDLRKAVSTIESVRASPDDLDNRIDDVVIEGLRLSDIENGLSINSGRIGACTLRGDITGINVSAGTVEGCSVTLRATGPASTTGIAVGNGAVVDSTVRILDTEASFVIGIFLDDADARGCTVILSGNAPVGFSSPFGAVLISECTVRAGFGTTGASRAYDCDGVITNCVAEGVESGFVVNEGVVRGCAAVGVTTPATLDPAVATADNNF